MVFWTYTAFDVIMIVVAGASDNKAMHREPVLLLMTRFSRLSGRKHC